MSRIYTDYLNETVLSIPDKFINVKTGESQTITPRVQEQLAYHSQNNTLIHLVLSALDQYLQPQISRDAGAKEILMEIQELKQMIQSGSPINQSRISPLPSSKPPHPSNINLQDIEELIEAFGG